MKERGGLMKASALLLLFSMIVGSHAELLTPPYFNLAEGRHIHATATCGEGTPQPELYCKLVGANSDHDDVAPNIIQGQVCDYCNPHNPKNAHPPENAIDGSVKWWQSPPLSRGTKFNEVNLTIDLGQEFHVAYVFIRMANSPRPGVWALERSIDNGKTYKPWQYFADTPSDCETYFGTESLQPITRDDSVICDTQFSKVVPLEGGEIVVSLVKNRPSANDFFNSTVLQDWSKATNVRMRLLRTKTLLGHLMSLQRQDPTVTRRYFYSIKDISIGGRCVCNGHASTCEYQDPGNELVRGDPYKLRCLCQHNTCGDQCERCCPGFVQKAWRQSKSFKVFQCEPCNCFGHTDECVYDEEVDRNQTSLDIHGNYDGGGVCQDCRDNTEGINCNRCKPKFYRPFGKELDAVDVCQPCVCDSFFSTGNCAEGTGVCECRPQFTPPNCDRCSFGYFGFPDCRPCECHINGTRGFQCEASGGQCPCKSNYADTFCNKCADGFYEFPECLDCGCNSQGALSHVCDALTGQCSCRNNYAGRSCDYCENGYFKYPDCEYCNCDIRGTEAGICNKETGQCLCKEGYGGARCDQCVAGYHGYPDCKPCGCSEVGSASTVCDASGKCPCLSNFAGRTCHQCSPGYYQYPECLACNCDSSGSIGISCDGEGKCQCKPNFDGVQCERCRERFYNFPICEECNCDPAGVIETFQGCGSNSVPVGELCQCKQRVTGRICNECRALFWNLQASNRAGCEECNCHLPGTIGGIGICDSKSGQCVCKPSVVSRRCDECSDGKYDLTENSVFGCRDCGCDIGGSVNNVCDKVTGQCLCRPRINGRTCEEPLQTHFFPTLYQAQYEAEDGRSPAGTAVRFGYSEDDFPNYSWKGYAVFSLLQNEIVHDVYIQKPSLYRMVLRYVNRNEEPVIGLITIKPDNPSSDVEQTVQVLLRPNAEPELVNVAGPTGAIPSPLVMNPGRWQIHTKIDRANVFLDYFVLLPAAFYEATILVEDVDTPCTMGSEQLCRQFEYPSCKRFDIVRGDGGFVTEGEVREQIREYFTDEKQLEILKVDDLPLLNTRQNELHFELRVTKPGRHVLLINYISPETQPTPAVLTVETSTQSGRDKGKVNLYQCQYTNLCRQPVTDKHNKVSVFKFDTNHISISLKGDNHTNVAVESIVAIPFEKWSVDYIRPKPSCVKKDGQCLLASFPIPPYSKRVEFEDGNEQLIATEYRPEGIIDTDATLVHLGDVMIDVRGQVPHEGSYVFVVHYYQPEHPEFNVDVLVHNGHMYEAKLPVTHCPSTSGCRAILRHTDNNPNFELTQNFQLSLKEPPGKGMWLDYVIVVPSEHYDEQLLHEEPQDQTGVFISQCGKTHFNIETTTEGFCRDAVFSLTSDFNNGALPCQCDFAGSLSFECEKFGGQCQCRPNVIGRKCEACRTGFYGFPECKPCDCPSTAFCDPDSGACICPPRVTGEKCNECVSYTYGFDPLIGCEECSCNPLGVLRGNLQCDLLTGLCECKSNVVGRSCDQCQPGFWSFPYCHVCNCDRRGTTAEICDQFSATCHCKNNVYGQACDYCKEGSFNLEESNPEGCTKCFCFGRTARCSSSDYYFMKETQMDGWTLALVSYTPDLAVQPMVSSPEFSRFTATVDLTVEEAIDRIAYFVAPADYYGKKHTSYGGHLNYTITYESGIFGSGVSGPDVILRGAGFDLLHFSVEQPAATVPWSFSLALVEQNFVLPSGLPCTHEQIMQALHALDGIFIRATYWEPSVNARIRNVTLDVGVAAEAASRRAVAAHSVEYCSCPPNYVGLSCEECAPGYYRSQAGTYGGTCVPCQCNGHADTCDVTSGICHNCKHNTTGDHCEKCDIGYHGDATHGTPFDCLICACPLPVPSNNFAFGCEVSPDGESISCDCMPGFYGARCESCAAGYFGYPERIGEACQKCSCSGNINPQDRGSCDSQTGDCLRCLNNTFGQACSLCAPGFYGDAVELKDCQSCVCDTCGTDKCNSYTGQCQCLPNVVGEKCDRCLHDHFGFSTCQGCTPCSCEEASNSSQCDGLTGQCSCKPGVTGRRCERCAPGFWNYGREGCVTCGCNTEYSVGVGCNPLSGQCECLPGVIGEKCDHCPHRWVLIEDQGCFECDSCAHDLLDVTDELQELIDPVMAEFDTVALGYFTTQRLLYINDSVTNLQPKVSVLDPQRVNLRPIETELETLEQDAKTQNRRVAYATENAGKLNGDKVYRDALDVARLIDQAIEDARMTVSEVSSLAYSLDAGSGSQVEPSLREAQLILGEIEARDLSQARHEAQNELQRADELHDRMTTFAWPVHNQSQAMEQLREEIAEFDNKLSDLHNYSMRVQEKASETESLNLPTKNLRLIGKVDTVKNVSRKADRALNRTKELIKDSEALLAEARGAFDKLNQGKERGADSQYRLNMSISDMEQELREVGIPVHEAREHANTITGQAAELDRMLADTRDISRSAVEAANAYTNIADAIDKAAVAAREATLVADNATSLDGFMLQSAGLGERTDVSGERSADLLVRAQDALNQTKKELAPQLAEAQASVAVVQEHNKQGAEADKLVNDALERIPAKSLEPVAREAMQLSEVADVAAQNALASIKNIVDHVPQYLVEAKQIPKDVDDTTKKLSSASSQVDRVNNIVPDINNLMGTARDTQHRLSDAGKDMSKQIEELKKKIGEARDLANRIKVGVTFYPNTTLELNNPEGLPLLATSTQISFFFRTEKPNGFLLYLGNEIGTHNQLRRSKTDDFVVLELENGYPVLTIDLGSGPQRIVSNQFVADGVWHQAIMERTGKHAKLSIKTEGSEGAELVDEKEVALGGTHSILNLDQELSKLFVGGYPTSFDIQPAVKYSSFEGQMEDLVIGGVPVGLWNFDDASNNGIGATERDKLVNLQPSTGFRFDGAGYAALSSEAYIRPDQLAVSFSFKTFDEEGLMFLVGDNPSYVASELRGGKVLTQINLGDGAVVLASKRKFNDGRWHSVDIRRSGRRAVVKIDLQIVDGETSAPGITETISAEKIYFGGYPGNHDYPDVTNVDFDGCIDKVEFDTTPVDLSLESQAFGVTPGCPVKVASIVSFDEGSPGYVRWPNATSNNFMEVTLKLRTKAKDGLVFYAESKDKLSTFSLYMLQGNIVLRSQLQDLATKGQYNDGEWHVVTATHKPDSLRLDIDDSDTFSTDSAPTQLYILYGNMYFGGIPSNLSVTPGTLATETPFIGCLGDATVNGVLINFANSTQRPRAILGKCQAKDQVVYTPERPIVEVETPQKPEKTTKRPKKPTTTLPPEITTVPDVIEEITTLPPTTPVPLDQCALPLYPAEETTSVENGIRFGSIPWGRHEYNSLPGNYKKKYDLSIEFKTFVGDGIIFYVADKTHTDYIAVYLINGTIYYGFNCGSGPSLLNSREAYDDGKWHTVTFSRQQIHGRLNIDDVDIQEGTSKGNTKSINVIPPFYVGGITEKVANFTNMKQTMKGVNRTFEGCLRNFRMNDQPIVDLGVSSGTAPCSENIEQGVFFSADGGFLKTAYPFRVGNNIHIKMDIRPRNNSGILVSCHGRRDYLVLQLINGAVKVSVDNGKGPIYSLYTPPHPHYFCDGKWHSIEVIKSKTVVTLSVDKGVAETGIGPSGTSSTDTSYPLFVGGHQNVAGRMRGFETTRRQYVGCIRNLIINNIPEKLSNFVVGGNVTLSYCPTN